MTTENHNFKKSIKGRQATPQEVAYRDGYVQGKVNEYHEQRYRRAKDAQIHEHRARVRENESAASGLLLGLLLAAILGTAGAIFYFMGRDSVEPPVINPEPAQPESNQSNAEPGNTTIIERTVERTERAAPRSSTVDLPDVNVQLPNPTEAEATQTTPAPQPEAGAGTAQDTGDIPSAVPQTQNSQTSTGGTAE